MTSSTVNNRSSSRSSVASSTAGVKPLRGNSAYSCVRSPPFSNESLTKSARFEIRWYRNDDFNVHYQEEWRDSVWKCRWDRHPNAHNSRDHFHPPPAASRTDAKNAQWPGDHRDVSRLVLDRIEERIETLWERQ